MPADPLRIIAFGAHPDDCELKAAGVAAKWAAAGHRVKFVAATNGDVGHFAQAGGPLALRRRAEAEATARILGITAEVLDIHDGELMPTLENRRTFARLIREWQADVVLAHRPWDYHPDHRYVGELVQDSAVVVAAAFFMPYTPAIRNPLILFYADGFQKPCPFEPDVVVGIDDVAEKKWAAIRAMPSQFADADSWGGRYMEHVPASDEERRQYILASHQQRNEDVANRYRAHLVARYGEAQGNAFRYAEAFEVCQYGRQPAEGELDALFPR